MVTVRLFDESANGYVRSEGCGVVVLKRLSEAVADNDRIYAVIKGSAVNQDGRTNGLTAPNGHQQQAVVRAALEDARLRPDALGYFEAHGTGTPLGDPIELQSLGAIMAERSDPTRKIPVGAVKSNLDTRKVLPVSQDSSKRHWSSTKEKFHRIFTSIPPTKTSIGTRSHSRFPPRNTIFPIYWVHGPPG